MSKNGNGNGNSATKIGSIRHKNKRANIPTEELRDFMSDEELTSKEILHRRDQSLDPQLIWKGKDEQDRQDLAIPVVPVYIQEKIHPQAIINALPRIEQSDNDQPNLFADFNGGPVEFNQKVDFYHHEQNWSNRLILGDSLLVMTSLAVKEGLKGKVQTIYLDPPYGIKFGSNWQVSTRKRDVKDGKAEDATRQPEQVRAFRDTWKLGIHSYLAYLRDRLVVARDLMTETGSTFVQIGDENVHLVRSVMDEVFGSENFVSLISVKKTATPSQLLDSGFFYIIWYARSLEKVKYRQLFVTREAKLWLKETAGGSWGIEVDGKRRPTEGTEKTNPDLLPQGAKIYALSKLTSAGPSTTNPALEWRNKTFLPAHGTHWKTTPDGLRNLDHADRLEARGGPPWFIRFHSDFPVVPLTNLFEDTSGKSAESIYVVQTQPDVIGRCLLMTTDPGDLVLDPTCGSGTTAYVAEGWGRRWITCDTSRVALALARTRLMGAKYPYYLLADSPDGIKREMELTGKVRPEYKTEEDIRKGFVYKRVPHVTLKSIANNPDIKKGMSRQQIDAAIAKHADTETLYEPAL
jgi:adenine-specific DNA-methyltransferase